MRKKLLVVIGLAALVAPVGCNTTEPYIWSWPHHKRRIRTVLEQFHELHEDFDRVIFDMEPYPVEIDY